MKYKVGDEIIHITRGKGKITRTDNSSTPYLIDDKYWCKHDEVQLDNLKYESIPNGYIIISDRELTRVLFGDTIPTCLPDNILTHWKKWAGGIPNELCED